MDLICNKRKELFMYLVDLKKAINIVIRKTICILGIEKFIALAVD